MKTAKFIIAALCLGCFPLLAAGQTAKMDAFTIRMSSLIDQIKTAKAADPKVTAANLTTAANALLEKSVATSLSTIRLPFEVMLEQCIEIQPEIVDESESLPSISASAQVANWLRPS